MDAREQLRRQVGTLRFDLNTLATAKPGKEDKKKALALRKDFIKQVRAGPAGLRSGRSGGGACGCVRDGAGPGAMQACAVHVSDVFAHVCAMDI